MSIVLNIFWGKFQQNLNKIILFNFLINLPLPLHSCRLDSPFQISSLRVVPLVFLSLFLKFFLLKIKMIHLKFGISKYIYHTFFIFLRFFFVIVIRSKQVLLNKRYPNTKKHKIQFFPFSVTEPDLFLKGIILYIQF